MLYLTRGLADTLLRLAADREPEAVTVPIAVSAAGDLDGDDLDGADFDGADSDDADTPVFTHFYMPRDGDSVTAVFGVDLGTPVGQTQGVFVSHPRGDPGVSKSDELREVVFVAVPPWDHESLTAYDRRGRRREFSILEVEPPEESPAP